MIKQYKELTIIIIVALIGAVSYYVLSFDTPSFADYPVQGIDVSHYQKNIKWQEIDKQQVQFAFIKATEGGDFKDEKFLTNWTEAKRQNIPVGAYHFFTFCKSGAEQAKNFIETVPIDSTSLPPVIDLEYAGNCDLTKGIPELLIEIQTFAQQLENHFHKKPILYVTSDFYEEVVMGKFMENPIWLRSIRNEPSLPDGRKWSFWQYENRGDLQGIKIYTDLNVFNGSRKEFEELLK